MIQVNNVYTCEEGLVKVSEVSKDCVVYQIIETSNTFTFVGTGVIPISSIKNWKKVDSKLWDRAILILETVNDTLKKIISYY